MPDRAAAASPDREDERTGARPEARERTRFWSDRRLWLMAGLGFAAGLPLPLSGTVLRLWLAEGGVSLGAIGLTANIGLAYTLKFLWAPLLDQAPPPGPFARLGRRRGWLMLVQPLLALSGVMLAAGDPVAAPGALLAAAAAVAFLSATQDVLIDAWRIETFAPREQGAALAAYVWGYRAALLISGSAAIAAVGAAGWAGVLLAVALLMALAPLLTLLAAEPAVGTARSVATRFRSRVLDGIVGPLSAFLSKPGAGWILAFVALFKLGEAIAGVMSVPFYHALGFDRAAIALANGPFTLTATLAGVVAGGWLVARLGVGAALILAGVAQTAANASYVLLAWSAGNEAVLYAAVVVEAFTDGIADAAFITYLSGLCDVAYTATQYALLSSLAAIASRTVGGLSGFLAAGVGWVWFYVLTMVAALPAMVIMLWLLRRFPPVERRD